MITAQPIHMLGQDPPPVEKPVWGLFAISMAIYIGIAGVLVYAGTRKRKRR